MEISLSDVKILTSVVKKLTPVLGIDPALYIARAMVDAKYPNPAVQALSPSPHSGHALRGCFSQLNSERAPGNTSGHTSVCADCMKLENERCTETGCERDPDETACSLIVCKE